MKYSLVTLVSITECKLPEQVSFVYHFGLLHHHILSTWNTVWLTPGLRTYLLSERLNGALCLKVYISIHLYRHT